MRTLAGRSVGVLQFVGLVVLEKAALRVGGRMDVWDLPFNRWLGIQRADAGAGDRPSVVALDEVSIQLVPEARHANHLGTVHATVIYGVAEAACGQCLLQQFPFLRENHLVVLRGIDGKYRQPAVLGTPLVGSSEIEEEQATKLRSQLERRRRASVSVATRVCQGSVEVFSGSSNWFIARDESSGSAIPPQRSNGS